MVQRCLTRSVIFVLAVMVLVACGQIPRPFKSDPKTTPNPLIEQGVPADVAVNPVRGTSVPMAKLIAQTVVDEIIRYDIVSYPNDIGTSRFILNGEVVDVAISTDNTGGRQIRWVLSTRAGKMVGTHVTPIIGTPFEWDYGSPKVIRDIGENTGRAVARLVLGGVAGGTSATIQAGQPVRTGIWIKPVTDAPGDGNFSLTRAIAFALGDSGMSVVKTPDRAKHFLKGRVHVDSPESGQQKVEITWIVTDPSDTEIGRARQRNSVPKGTFDGRWGQTAVMISLAAVNGIKDILVSKKNKALTQGEPAFKLVYPGDENGEELKIPPPSLEPN